MPKHDEEELKAQMGLVATKEFRKQYKWDRSLNILFTVVALIVSSISVCLSVRGSQQLSTFAANVTQQQAITTEKLSMQWATTNLISPANAAYIERNQKLAALHDPPLIKATVKEGYVPDDKGTSILTKTDLWNDTKEIFVNNPQKPTNEIILELGIDKIYYAASNNQVSLDELIGTVATLIQNLKENEAASNQ
jgi:hypothetical protein